MDLASPTTGHGTDLRVTARGGVTITVVVGVGAVIGVLLETEVIG